MKEIKMNEINIEEVRLVKELLVSFLQGFNYGRYDDAYDFTDFHDDVASGEFDLDELAKDLYYLNTFSWITEQVYKKLIIECIPSLKYALKGMMSDNEIFFEIVEVEGGFEKFYRNDMFRIYHIKTKMVFDIVEKLTV